MRRWMLLGGVMLFVFLCCPVVAGQERIVDETLMKVEMKEWVKGASLAKDSGLDQDEVKDWEEDEGVMNEEVGPLPVGTTFEVGEFLFEVIEGPRPMCGLRRARDLERKYLELPTFVTYGNVDYEIAEILDNAFHSCRTLEEIYIPDSVKFIGNYAFDNCRNLRHVRLPKYIRYLGGAAFCFCESLEEIELPDSILLLLGHTFNNCSSLKRIQIPESVLEIRMNVFYNCKNLEEVMIPESVTTIEGQAFSGCGSLRRIKLPPRLESIAFMTFYECENLEEINIPETVESIGKRAFANCRSLKNIVIPQGTFVAPDAFEDCDISIIRQ